MKKLLSTTAIIGAVAFATSASAADLQVNVGGFLDFQAGYTSDDIVGETDDANEINFNNDTEVHFSVDGKADNGLEYGAVIELEADINAGDSREGGTNADKTYLFLQGGWGRVELGGNTDASEALSVNTSTFASATGGIDGDFYRYAGAPTGADVLTRPDLPIAFDNNNASGIVADHNEDATKITYYSPRFAGFQAGVSYIPSSDSAGTLTAPSGTNLENIFAGGINYAAQWDSVGFKASVSGQTGDEKGTGDGDLSAWNAGANVNFAGFTVGGSYGAWDEDTGNNDDVDFFDLGLGYEFGAFSASASYFSSDNDTDNDEFDNLAIGIDYKLAPGLVPYAEVSFFDFDGAGTGTANDNDGTVVILGTELSF